MRLRVHRFSFLIGATAALSLAQASHAAVAPGQSSAIAGPPVEAPRKSGKATSIPEPGSPAVMFLLAAGGLALGRRLSRSGRRHSSDG